MVRIGCHPNPREAPVAKTEIGQADAALKEVRNVEFVGRIGPRLLRFGEPFGGELARVDRRTDIFIGIFCLAVRSCRQKCGVQRTSCTAHLFVSTDRGPLTANSDTIRRPPSLCLPVKEVVLGPVAGAKQSTVSSRRIQSATLPAPSFE